MDTTNLAKSVVLTSAAVVTSFGVSKLALDAIEKFKPQLLEVTSDETDKKQIIIDGLKVIGVTLTVALIAGLAAEAVKTGIEGAVWPEVIDSEIIE